MLKEGKPVGFVCTPHCCVPLPASLSVVLIRSADALCILHLVLIFNCLPSRSDNWHINCLGVKSCAGDAGQDQVNFAILYFPIYNILSVSSNQIKYCEKL